jgi:hypothetical protein
MSAKIQNLRVWSMNLPVQQVVRECSVPMKPFGPAPPCVTGGTMNGPPTAASPSDTSAANTIANVTKCAPTPPLVPPPPPPVPVYATPSWYSYDATSAFNQKKQYLYEQQLKKNMLKRQ